MPLRLPFFRRRRPPAGSTVQDLLHTSFRLLEPRPFPAESAPGYRSVQEKRGFRLSVLKQDCFAWTLMAGSPRYRDFHLDASVSFDPDNGHSAAGFVFRYVDEENFYAFLLSDRGLFRFDVLFNGTPIHLVEWTPFPLAEDLAQNLRILARGSHFSFYAEDEWLAEIEDETQEAGTIGFAVQNYHEKAPAAFLLDSLTVESRPPVVERDFVRWVQYIPVDPEARLRFAESLVAQGQFGAAAVQLRKGLRGRGGTAREHFLLADCLLRLSVFDGAASSLARALSMEPGNVDCLRTRANLLYLTNDFLAARDFIEGSLHAGLLKPDPALWNLLGNCEYGLGSWARAAKAYEEAVALQPEAALLRKNAARAFEMAGGMARALELYLEAARLFFREGAYEDLTYVLSRVGALDPGNREGIALEAKVLFHEGKVEEAFPMLSRLVREGTADSSIPYLLGLVLSGRGERAEALEAFRAAAALEPKAPLYRFRLAESLHLLGRDCTEELAMARSLDPGDPWIANLHGAVAMENGDLAGAREGFQTAYGAAPHEADICLNLSELLFREGRDADALSLLSDHQRDHGADARLANQEGNIHARRGRFAEAVQAYESAVRLAPGQLPYRENCASACLEIDMVHRAEELLYQCREEAPSASVYNLLGNAAARKGERQRAELAYVAGLNIDPDHPDLNTNLAALCLERGDLRSARSLAQRVLAADPGRARAAEILRRAADGLERNIDCAACGRRWRVPRDLPAQPSFSVHGEPPGDAPAGRCGKCGKVLCVACAASRVRDGRFLCPDCGEPLRLSDDGLRWLLSRSIGDGEA